MTVSASATVIAVVVIALFASPADAHQPKRTSPGEAVTHVQDLGELERAVSRWQRVTGNLACGGASNIEFAWHSFPKWRAWAHAHVSACRIHFDPARVKRMRELRGDQWLCLLVHHEVGHLAHRGHARRGIMSVGGVLHHGWCR